MGTHKQLKLETCGFLERTGYPCITCGMTTAFAWTVRGRIDKAFIAQPAGCLAALLCLAAALTGAGIAVTGKKLALIYYLAFHIQKILIITILILLASWGWMCLTV